MRGVEYRMHRDFLGKCFTPWPELPPPRSFTGCCTAKRPPGGPFWRLAPTIDPTPRQLTARWSDRRATASTRKPIDGRGMSARVFALVEAIIMHAGFLDRLYHGEVGLTATL